MQHPFGLAGRARCIKNKQRVFRVHRFRRAIGAYRRHFVVIPAVAAFLHCHCCARALHDDHVCDAWAFGQRFIHILFQRHGFAAAQAFIRGNDNPGLAILDAPRHTVRREAAKYHRMHRPDARAGQHGVSRFRNHRHVNGDPVTLFDPARLQHIGEMANCFMQRVVGDVLALRRIVAFPDDRDLLAAFRQVPVHTIGGHIQGAIFKPFDVQMVGIVGPVAHLGERRHPVQPRRFLAPEAVRIAHRCRIGIGILRGGHESALFPFLRHRNDSVAHGVPLCPRLV